MNILLWVLQVVLALLSISGGAFQIFKLEDLKKTTAAMRALPKGLWMLLGAVGCVAGVGLLVPQTTVISAAVMAVHSAVVSLFYLKYKDRAPLPYSLLMMAIAVFICFGRIELQPF
jgi:hypothetical protein